VQQLGAALSEFERLSHDHSRQGSALLSRANSPGWLFAEAAEQAGKTLQRELDSCVAGPAPRATPPAAAAAAVGGSSAAAGGSLQQLLCRHVNARHLHMVSLHMILTNTLSRLQIAKLLVSRVFNHVACRLQQLQAIARRRTWKQSHHAA
jgi:hypothetical protein